MIARRRAIVVVGGGGHARRLIDLIRLAGEFDPHGILDAALASGKWLLGVPVLGSEGMLEDLFVAGVHNACIASADDDETARRNVLFRLVKSHGYAMPALLHPAATVSSNATLGEGVQVMANAVVEAQARLSENSIVGTSAILEHDAVLGRGSIMGPASIVRSSAEIGEGAVIGPQAVIMPGVRVGRGAVIGSGAIVRADVIEGARVAGR